MAILATAVVTMAAALAVPVANGRTQAVRVSSPPVIDGRLEEAWQQGLLFEHFAQLEPDVVPEARARTEVFFLYDADNVYLAARVHQPRATIRAAQGRRDAAVVQEGDAIAFIIDPLASGNGAYFFIINPANAIADGRLDVAGTWDTTWDGVFSSATWIGDDEWIVEVRIPLASIGSQGTDDQSWGILVQRTYAQERRKLLSQLSDANRPYQISEFHRVAGLHGLNTRGAYAVTPYLFRSWREPRGGHAVSETKMGLDLKLRPTASTTLLLTANPDYAQLESDREMINVNDVPVTYAEKRPFFTESSDLYPGLAVYSRRIQDVRAGIKLRQVLPGVKYDATFVQDKDDTRWFLGDVRWTDDKTFHAELIGGVKDNGRRRDYNVTTNIRGWWFDRRLTAYAWFGTINGPEGGKNEWESVSAVRWVTRTSNAGVSNNFKSQLYNPNVVGSDTLSNEVTVWAWAEYSWFNEAGWLRRFTPRIDLHHYDLYTGRDGGYADAKLALSAVLHLSDALGDGEVTLAYLPPIEQKFRYRNVDGYDPVTVGRDAYGPFVLERQHMAGFDLILSSDTSRPLALTLAHCGGVVRGARSRATSLEAAWKAGSRGLVSYVFDSLDLAESRFQHAYREAVHRLKLEYNPTDRLNVRAIFDLNRVDAPADVITTAQTPTRNLTVSWEYLPGSSLFLVVNDWRRTETPGTRDHGRLRSGERSAALKVSWNVTL